jgi:hypothetical protein
VIFSLLLCLFRFAVTGPGRVSPTIQIDQTATLTALREITGNLELYMPETVQLPALERVGGDLRNAVRA